MSKRDILRHAKNKGLEIEQIDWAWEPTPGESVPVWSIYVSTESADRFGINTFHQFGNTKEALEWIAEIEPVAKEQTP